MSQLRIYLSRHGRRDFLSLLTERQIAYAERRPPPGVIVASSEWIEILSTLGPPVFTSIAYALGKWLKSRSSRRAIITLKNREIHHVSAQGYSAEEVGKILEQSTKITAIQPTPDDDSTGPDRKQK